MSAFITKQVTFSIDHSSRCKCQEYKHQRVGHEFQLLSSVRISTKSVTHFEISGSTELTRRHHNVRDQWLLTQGEPTQMHLDIQDQRLLMQGIKVLTSVQETRWRKIGSTCISRIQRDTLRISWNVVCKLVFIRFVQSQVHVLHGFARIQTWDRVSISSENPRRTNSSQGARAASESVVTTSPSCAAE